MSLRGTYAWSIKVAEGKFHGTTEERDGKLHWKGSVATEVEKNEIWNAIKTMQIFELNKDQLSDPDKIKPGQVLRLP